MKINLTNHIKLYAFVFLGLFIASCSEDDAVAPITNDGSDKFDNIEIGNSEFKVPQFNVDLHTEFDYEGSSKVQSIHYDITPVDVSTPGSAEVKWQLSDHLVPESYYEGQLNPHIHYHIYFDPDNQFAPAQRPAKGIYSIKITVQEEDGTVSSITKEFEIVKKFSNVEVGSNNELKAGSDDLHIEYSYDAGSNTIEEMKFELWFEEWREGQNVPVGSWDSIVVTLSEEEYKNSSDIHYHMAIDSELPLGDYWLNIYVKESGTSEAVKLSVPFSVVN